MSCVDDVLQLFVTLLHLASNCTVGELRCPRLRILDDLLDP